MKKNNSNSKNKNKKRKNFILNVLIVFCAATFLFSSYKLISYYFEYKQMDDVYANINELVIKNFVYDANSEGLLSEAPEIDMDELKKINEEIIGYIIIPGTKVSYPIAHSDDPIKYLNYDIRNNPSRGGAIFTSGNNATDFSDDNTIIYGHNMIDGSMFGQLAYYIDKDDFLKEHAYIYLYTANEVRLYQIFSCQVSQETSELYTYNFASNDDLVNLVHKENKNSLQPAKEVPDQIESIITLSTCRNETGQDRTVIQAYLVNVKTIE